MQFWRWGPWWLLWIQAGTQVLSTSWEQFSDLGASVHRMAISRSSRWSCGDDEFKAHKDHIAPQVLEDGRKPLKSLSKPWRSIFFPVLNFLLFPSWQFYCMWRLIEGQRRLWKISVAFQRHWCKANLLKLACVRVLISVPDWAASLLASCWDAYHRLAQTIAVYHCVGIWQTHDEY